MEILLTNPDGTVLDTEATYVAEDITITPVLGSKSVTPTQSVQEIEPDTEQVGLKKVTVGAIQTETKTVAPSTSQQTVTPSSGKYLSQVTVSAIQQETKTVTPTASAQNVTPSSGKYLTRVTVNAVPSESKTVTPTKSAQSVTPSSGKWLSSVTVNAIPDNYIVPSGSQDITENGTFDVTSKASVNVNVPTVSAVEEVATSSAMDALLVEANVGKYYKFTGTTDSNYTNGDLYLVESGGAVTHSLTFPSGKNVEVTVDGVSVTSPYTLTGNATIIVSCGNDNLTINGTTYNSSQTITLSGVDVVCESSLNAPDNITITINYTA